MTLSLFHIRKCLAAPLAWLMVLAMLSPVSPHLAEGIALCIGEDHVGVEKAGASHHESDGRVTPLASASTEKTSAEEANAAQRASSSPRATGAAAGASGASSPGECADIPLRLVQSGDACYQFVQNGSGPEVPPRFASQTVRLAQASDATPSAPNCNAQEPRRSHTPASSSASLASSTVVLLI